MSEGGSVRTRPEEVRWNKGPPSLGITEHWNYEDRKDCFGGNIHTSQGPLPVSGRRCRPARGLWGRALADEITKYNHMVGLKMMGEMMPHERNMVTLADEEDHYGLKVARVTYNWCDDNKAMVKHSPDFMSRELEASGAKNVWRQEDDTNHLADTARMGNNRRTGVVNADCCYWDVPNLFICDGSVFPTTEGVNSSLTIQALALRTADRIQALAKRGEL